MTFLFPAGGLDPLCVFPVTLVFFSGVRVVSELSSSSLDLVDSLHFCRALLFYLGLSIAFESVGLSLQGPFYWRE